MVSQPSGALRYQEISVLTASPLQLTIILHDTAIHSLNQARMCLQSGDSATRTRCVGRALAALAELQAGLDHEADPSLAASLDRQYCYMAKRVFEGNLEQKAAPLAEVMELLTTLRAGWTDLAARGTHN